MNFHKNLKKISLITFLLIFFISCNNHQKKDDNSNKNTEKTTNIDNTSKSEDDIKYLVYHNSRYGYSATYPSTLIPQGESDSGDGQRFISKNKKTTLSIYRDFKIEDNITEAYNADIDMYIDAGKTVTYKTKTNNYYVISGYNGNNIYYHKTIYNGIDYITAVIEYPTTEKEVYDKISEHIFNNLK